MTVRAEDPIPAEVWRIALVIVFGAFMAGLDTSLVNVGLDTIASDLAAPLADTQWVTTGYLIALAAALPAGPWLQRRFGPARVWLGALIAFTVSSGLCAIVPSLGLLVAARAVQGLSGGLLVPAGQSVLGAAAGPRRMGRVMATSGIPVVLAPAVGPALGGILIAVLSWRWLFVVNVPVGIAALVLGVRLLPRSPTTRSARLDVLGLLLLGVGLPAISFGGVEIGDGGSAAGVGAGSAAAGLLLLIAFVTRSLLRGRRDGAEALIDLRLFGRPAYAAAQVSVLFTGVSLFGGLILLPLYYEVLRHLGVVQTGLLLLAYGAGATAALRVGGRLTDRVGGGISCSIGLVLTIAATAPFAVLPPHADLVLVEALQLVRGVGVGMAGLPAMSSAFSAAADRITDATTTANILQRVGGSAGSAGLVLIVARSGLAAPAAFHVAFLALTATAALALAAAIVLTVVQTRYRQPPRDAAR